MAPEQRAQLATPSYKLKKEKRDAKRVDNSTPTEDIALVDPASVSVIGAVGGAASSQSPSVPPEKKTKKDKPPPVLRLRNLPLQVRMTGFQNWMLNGPNGLTGWRLCCWLDLWNLPSLLMSGLPLYTHHQPLSLRTQSLSFSLLTDLWTLLLSALAQTLMLPCSCRLASFLQVLLHKIRPFLRTLAQTLLLPSSSRLASQSGITIPRQGALVQTSLLVSISRPASHTPTLTDRLHRRCRNLVNQLPTDLTPTHWFGVTYSPKVVWQGQHIQWRVGCGEQFFRHTSPGTFC